MPPHIFAAGQQAYHSMLLTNSDQSLVLMGVSGSGKTFNARYLLRYLATVGYVEEGPVTSEFTTHNTVIDISGLTCFGNKYS